ncbi:MAG: sulfite reductase flavoprotein subunit alpha [Gammaproteobacteria bacterium]
MFRRIVFQTHWLLGITLGLVLAIMGVTGALLSFEDEIVDALSPSRVARPEYGVALSPDRLLQRIREQKPSAVVGQLRLWSDPSHAVQVRLQERRGDGSRQKAGNDRGVTYVNPYTGEILGSSAGGAFFSFAEELHRFLAIPAAAGHKDSSVGRQITGCAALALVFFAVSGLYLRWPRNPLSWRSWFVLHMGRTGRNFFREIHAVAGGWVALFYLLTALTGLTWSYDWYRDAANTLLGESRDIKRALDDEKGVGSGTNEEARGSSSGKPLDEKGRNDVDFDERTGSMVPRRPEGGFEPTMPNASLDAIWADFHWVRPEAADVVGLSMPRGGGPIRVEVPLLGGFHDGIMDRYFYDASTGELLRTDLTEDRPVGRTITGAMLAFHSGAFLGTPGRALVMLASFAMPVFLVTGLLLYFSRRAKRSALPSVVSVPSGPSLGGTPPVHGTETLIIYASQTGGAYATANLTASAFNAGGMPAKVKSLASLDSTDLKSARQALFVISTYGDGEPPDTARAFARRVMRQPGALSSLRYGILALGDREYPRFCWFGHAVDRWLKVSGATRAFDTIEVNADDPAAHATWQRRLVPWGARFSLDAELGPPPFERWLLMDRQLLNPGSLGGPVFLLRLVPRHGPLPQWNAGDIAEVQPRNDPQKVAQYLTARGLSADQIIAGHTLHEHLSVSELPALTNLPIRAEQLFCELRPLAPREYSIASVWRDGALELVVRQVSKADGLGSASGWLTAHASLADSIELRIRANPNFYRCGDRPMILVGNGTGIAGLRAHLRNSQFDDDGDHWLLFGERQSARDAFFQEEIEYWLACGTLARFDAAWSRGGFHRRYVQHVVKENAELIRHRIDMGASVMVCGSLQGMAPAVDRALRAILGNTLLEGLVTEGRYRRDVY